MRKGLAIAGALFVTGCGGAMDPPGLVACESAIKKTLVSPASYKRVQVESMLTAGERHEITYDAANSYGTLLRANGVCYVDSKTGKAEWFKHSSSEPD